ncbi:heme exporter protein CcmD [Lysobacter sp. GX 14042]|uniref:heme exporter protein CcmD n=1 Tax=Lysobacter sp. GX 14042 TaxID=2907155 RepID=UPI001F408EDB|nr:heme exporter protein CcmD [Lysobacter sp. GX 14042]MCE7031224.1 heme exporter protein CcmD [Lysobacter sp. GX 14042]
MSYLGYVIAAYAVFLVVLAWDAAAGYFHVRRELRAARRRAARQAPAPSPGELQR